MRMILAVLVAFVSFIGVAHAYPGPESFRQTCTIYNEDAYAIDADCLTENGYPIRNHYIKQRCDGALGNINGYITCTSSNRQDGNGGILPPGSYLQTCSSCEVRGDILNCNCMNGYGGFVNAWIQYRQCNRIGNISGRLVCY